MSPPSRLQAAVGGRVPCAARLARAIALAASLAILRPSPAAAQEAPPPRIGPFVFDVRGAVLKIPSSDQLAQSRGMQSQVQLPGLGLGATAGVHLYPLRWKAITFGIGAEAVIGRAHSSAVVLSDGSTGPGASERFVSAAPQLSFNFQGRNGWSYISGGIGYSQWQIIPDGQAATSADSERLRTVDYGGGARWFIWPRVAFSLDVRIWQMNPGVPHFGYPGSPRANMLVFAAGLSFK